MQISRNLKLFYHFKGRNKKVALVFAKKYAKEIFSDRELQEKWLKNLYKNYDIQLE